MLGHSIKHVNWPERLMRFGVCSSNWMSAAPSLKQTYSVTFPISLYTRTLLMQAAKKALKTKSRNWFPVSPWPAGLCSVVSLSTEGFPKAFPKPEPLSLGRDQAEFPSPEHGLGGTDCPKLLLHSGCIANEQHFWKSGHGSVKLG